MARPTALPFEGCRKKIENKKGGEKNAAIAEDFWLRFFFTPLEGNVQIVFFWALSSEIWL